MLALDGLAGNVDVLVEEGDLSVVLGDAAYGELSVAVEKGSVDSAIPLEGSILGGARPSIGVIRGRGIDET